MESNETSVRPIEVGQRITQPFSVLQVSNEPGMTIEVDDQRTVITAQTEKIRGQLLIVLKNAGFPILFE